MQVLPAECRPEAGYAGLSQAHGRPAEAAVGQPVAEQPLPHDAAERRMHSCMQLHCCLHVCSPKQAPTHPFNFSAVQALENPTDREQFQAMLPQLLNLIGKALMAGNTLAGQVRHQGGGAILQ